MTTTITRRNDQQSSEVAAGLLAAVDPLGHDGPSDETFVATRRALCRVATLAAEAGARFQRDCAGVDPMAWMLAPRLMFGGLAPLDACLRRGAFVRGLIVHGLGLDVDVEPAALDEVLEDDVDGSSRTAGMLADGYGDGGVPRRRLFTATIVAREGARTLHAFHASVGANEREIASRLALRLGAVAAGARIVDGYEASGPMVEAMVAPAMSDLLSQVAADPLSPLGAALDFNVEQRFLG